MLAPVEATFISIHAPRAGRDLVYGLLANGFTEFQSTRPVRGATDQVHRGELAGSISIHAPRAGRDVALDQQQANDVLFQSTRPVRGATVVSVAASGTAPVFQSTRPVRGATPSAWRRPCRS